MRCKQSVGDVRDDGFHRHILPVLLLNGHIPPVLWGELWEHPPKAFFVLLSLIREKKWNADWPVLWGSRNDHGRAAGWNKTRYGIRSAWLRKERYMKLIYMRSGQRSVLEYSFILTVDANGRLDKAKSPAAMLHENTARTPHTPGRVLDSLF